MHDKAVWATSTDGSLEYVQLTQTLLEEAIAVMQKSFYMNENICIALGIPASPECFGEIDTLLKWAANDGMSVAAVDKASGRLAGVSFNKLQEAKTSDFYDKHIKLCVHPPAKNLYQWMQDFEECFDILEHCKVQSAMEIMFLGVLPEFRKRGIAKKLFEVSIDLARSWNQGKDVRVCMDEEALEITRPPEIVTAICTSFVTQKIAKDFVFERACEVSFGKFVYDGVSLESKVPSSTKYLTYEYIRL